MELRGEDFLSFKKKIKQIGQLGRAVRPLKHSTQKEMKITKIAVLNVDDSKYFLFLPPLI